VYAHATADICLGVCLKGALLWKGNVVSPLITMIQKALHGVSFLFGHFRIYWSSTCACSCYQLSKVVSACVHLRVVYLKR
jgi:hypothetical protein